MIVARSGGGLYVKSLMGPIVAYRWISETGNMLLDPLTIYADHIAWILAEGERAVVAAGVGYFSGREDDGTVEPRLSLKDRLLAHLFALPIYTEQMMGVLFGSSLRARPGTLAAGLHEAIEDVMMMDCLLTDRRLLMVADLTVEQPVIGWQCRLDDIRGIVPAPRLMQLGRIMVSFQDESWIALVAGVLLRSRAKRVIAGWESVRPR